MTFSDFVDSHKDEVDIEMPILHTTESAFLRPITEVGKLHPQQCSVFNRPLLYFFYGRPAYRSKKAWKTNAGVDLCPVCFVLKPCRLKTQIDSIYPFDSGAASSGLFEPHISQDEINRYKLSPLSESLRKFIRLYFLSNGDYFVAKADPALDLTEACQEAIDYFNLITHDDAVAYDDRRSAIEISSSESVELMDNIMTIVLPFSMLEDRDIRQIILNEWGIRPITYSTVHGMIPGHYQPTILQKLSDFLKETYI